jgi:hypothetical protein
MKQFFQFVFGCILTTIFIFLLLILVIALAPVSMLSFKKVGKNDRH